MPSAPPLLTNDALDEWLSRPTAGVVETLRALPGDVLVLGAGGKMGPTLARMARRALDPGREVFAVSRFSSASAAEALEKHGVSIIRCDLLDRAAVSRLPDAANVIFMAGQKFGTTGVPEMTWMMNAVLPAIAAERYAASRIVVFSTGCVYPFVAIASGGSREEDALAPPGEYAQSCVARERVFTYFSKSHGAPTLIFRLNYAIDLRYGVLHDVAWKVLRSEPVDVTMGYANVIWQGDANARALQCLAHTARPPAVLNVTGRELISIRSLAERFGELLGRAPVITGKEAPTAWLSNATKSFDMFGEVSVPLEEMIQATADWVRQGGASLGKPTHFENRNGDF
ncbi:MAG: NAD(P)-dependent oxidoreductase [Candidatus Sumerlaeota bacterium]|nr:NAD(P)-dependent oxidoreductase [Candidatus Sumerlaeota bacterium]